MRDGTALLLFVLLTAAFLAGLYFVVRAGVTAGIRRALPDSALRPTDCALRRHGSRTERRSGLTDRNRPGIATTPAISARCR